MRTLSARRTSFRYKGTIFIGLTCAFLYLYIAVMPENSSISSIPRDSVIRPNVIFNETGGIIRHTGVYTGDKDSRAQAFMQERSNESKVHHIGFLKVHKAASSTMQNIFFRFGLRRRLTFVLPSFNNYLKPGVEVLPVRPDEHYDILAIHTNYSKEQFDRLLPADSIKIGIVRQPLERMISAAFYYRYHYHKKYLKKLPDKTYITDLVNNPEKYEKLQFSQTKNAMGYDFGFPSDITASNVSVINTHLDLIKREFKLIMVAERFEESLVLMKRYLNWELEDILYIKTNINSHKGVDRTKLNMKKFRKTCFLDYILYNTFSDILKEKIAKEGNDFSKEVFHFKSVLSDLFLYCLGIKKVPKLVVPKSRWNKRTEVNKEDCYMMLVSENDMLVRLRDRHMAMHS